MMKTKMIAVLLAAVISLPATAQWSQDEPQSTVSSSIGSTGFQSTSSMQSSGSMYSPTPTLGTDGRAMYDEPSYTPAEVPSGPRKVGPPTPGGQPTPVGEPWVMLLFAALAAGYIARRHASGISANN